MELDLIKNKIQNEAVEAWKNNNCIGTLALATGTGKTFCFFKALLSFNLDKKAAKNFSVLFLAETTQREIDLRADLIKFSKVVNKDILNFNIKFACYQTVYKWENESVNFVCADEIHNSLSPSYSQYFLNNKYDYLLGLSATPDRTVKYTTEDGVEFTKGDLLDKICPIVYTYTLNQSVEDNASRKLNIFVINHHLDMVNKNYVSGTKLKPFLATERAAYDYWDNEFKKSLFIQDQRVKEFKIRTSAAARAKVLYKAKSKATAIEKLLKNLTSKVLIFGNDLDALLEITPNTVSSRNSDIVNRKLRDSFDEGELDVLAANKLLVQGANIKNLDNVIMHSYYSKELQNVQKLGRLRNSDNQGNVFVFKTANTNEVKWFDKMFENITAYNMIYCDNIEDCITKLKKL